MMTTALIRRRFIMNKHNLELTSCERDARDVDVAARPTSRGSSPRAAPNLRA